MWDIHESTQSPETSMTQPLSSPTRPAPWPRGALTELASVSNRAGFKLQLCHSWTGWAWASTLTFLTILSKIFWEKTKELFINCKKMPQEGCHNKNTNLITMSWKGKWIFKSRLGQYSQACHYTYNKVQIRQPGSIIPYVPAPGVPPHPPWLQSFSFPFPPGLCTSWFPNPTWAALPADRSLSHTLFHLSHS